MNYNLDDLFSANIETSYYTEEQDRLINEYITKFNHGLPMAYIPKNVGIEELFEKIRLCIEIEEDILLDLLNVTIEPGCKY